VNNQSLHSARLTERLLADRIVLLTEAIDEEVTHYLLAKLLFLMDRDNKQPISLYIDSPGGSVVNSFAILDTIVEASAPIHTTCVGFAGGMALLILACGAKGKRRALPHAEVAMARYTLGPSSQHHSNEARLVLKDLDDLIVSKFSYYSGEPEQNIRSYMDEERIFNAYEARGHGLIDQIVMV